jgi:hypothetical protein
MKHKKYVEEIPKIHETQEMYREIPKIHETQEIYREIPKIHEQFLRTQINISQVL